METRPPTVTRILVAIGFALSCFALALFLWITFGGPLPLKPEGYRFKVPFNEATQLAVQSDVRISGVSVGKVKSIDLGDNGLADATIEIDSQYAPIPDDTRAILRQKTLLGETYVELTPGNRNGADAAGGRHAAGGPGRRRRSSSTRSSAPSTPAPAPPSRTGCREPPAALNGRGADLSAAIGELDPFAEQTNRVLRILDSQQPAVQQLFRNGGDVFQALSERQGQLRGLIQNSNAVFQTTARRNAGPRETCSSSFPPSCTSRALTLDRLDSFAANTDPLVQPAAARREAAQPDPDRRRQGGARPQGVLRRPAGRRSTPPPPASRRSAGCWPTTSPRCSPGWAATSTASAPTWPISTRSSRCCKLYKHEITAFLGNSAAATNLGFVAPENTSGNPVKCCGRPAPSLRRASRPSPPIA